MIDVRTAAMARAHWLHPRGRMLRAPATPLSRAVLAALTCAAPVLGLAMPGASAPPDAKSRPAGVMDVRLKDGKKVQLFDARSAATPVAKVGTEIITVRDLGEAIAGAHGQQEPGGMQGAVNVSSVLDRLIDVRLIASEAHTMGIDELPEFKAEVQKFTEAALRDLVRRRAAARAKVDKLVVERAYKDAIREWKVASVLFEKEADAKELEERVKAGGKFDELAARAIAEKKAKARQDGEFMADSKLLPEIAAVVRKLPEGTVSGVAAVPGGYVLLRVDGVRFTDDPQKRAEVEAQVRNAAQVKAISQYATALVEKQARIDRKLLASLDYDGKEAPLEKLAKDRRVLARIEGEKGITVAELTQALEKKFFHGAKQAAESKRVNKDKEPVLHAMLVNTLFLKEARRKGIQDTEELKYLVREKRHSLAFGALLERVILPALKIGDGDLKAYHEEHGAEFTYPAMYRLEGLAFSSAAAADAAAKKLRSGTDFGWMRANADGQLDPSKQGIQFSAIPVEVSTLPAGLAGVLAGSKAGDYRTYAQDGVHYVIRTMEFTAPRRRPLDEVRDVVQNKVYAQKIQASLAEWVRKLREHYPVEVLIASVG